jgi:uncharacterized iron-regulated membrane protein
MPATEESLAADESRPIAEILRQIHRWIALALVLFIAAIGTTGAILHGILAIYGDSAPTENGNMPASVAAFRQLLFKIHTGFLIGVPGAYYGLICGLGLLFFSISGLWMYLNLYRSRSGLGRKGLFWTTKKGNDAALRSLHRWFTVGLVLFTTIIAFTGSSLDFDFVRNNMIPGSGPRPGGGGPGGPGGPGGSPGGPPPSGAGWHELNFTIHKLSFLGTAGHVLGVFIGLGLVTMAISGLWMYLAMHARRTRAGQKGLFW